MDAQQTHKLLVEGLRQVIAEQGEYYETLQGKVQQLNRVSKKLNGALEEKELDRAAVDIENSLSEL